MKTKDRLDLAHWAAQTARVAGANNAAVNLGNSRSVEVEYRDGQLDNVKESTQNSLTVAIYADNKYSSHTTNDLRRESLARFIKEAVAMTKFLSADEFRKLPDPKYYEGKESKDLDLIDPGFDRVTADSRVKMAQELQELTAAGSDRLVSSSAGYNDRSNESIKVHTNGFEGISQTTSFTLGVEATVDDGKGGRPADWCYATARYLGDLPKPGMLADEAVSGALRKVGAEKVASGVYDMLITARAAGNPVYTLRGPLSGRSLQQKRSFLDGKLGEKIVSDKLTIIDEPFIPRGLGSRYYDGEGLTCRRRSIIEKGVLKEYLIDTYYARKLGVDPTGGSTSNIVFEYGDQSLDDMIKNVEKGILVTSFIGGNSNGTTGDFSWGLQGMLIENGKLVKPVAEMNISGNLLDLWSNLEAVGNDPYEYSSIRRPSLHFRNVNFSGI